MPLPAVWGPRLWEILHKIGSYHWLQETSRQLAHSPATVLAKDWRRELEWLINHLESIVPCAECRQHIESYRKIHPIYGVNPGRWIWEFHEAVNERLGKPKGPEFSDEIGKHGKSLRALWKEYTGSIFESVQMGNLPGKNVSEFARHLFLFQGFSGV